MNALTHPSRSKKVPPTRSCNAHSAKPKSPEHDYPIIGVHVAGRRETSWQDIYLASIGDQVRIIEFGIGVPVLGILAEEMEVSGVRLLEILGLPRSTVTRKAKAKMPLGTPESERILGMMRLIGQVEQMVSESGDPDGFEASRWIANWLERPLPALGGKAPASYMSTNTGQRLISTLLSQAQSGTFA